MRKLLGALILVVVLLGVKELYKYWEEVRAKHRREAAAGWSSGGVAVEPTAPSPGLESLPGLPPHLEPSLEAARRQGAGAVKTWLKHNRASLQDPRLAAIELDYVVMVAGKDFGEAREVFAAVKARTPTNSPVYPRLKSMQTSYQ